MPSIALPISLRGQLLFGSRFSPVSLFAGGAQGVWYEPSDLTTMFTDRAGTIPVTAPGQTVGLRLDKSKGLALGAELVTNGDFSNPVTTGWTTGFGASLSVDGARLKITSGGDNPFALYAMSTVANRWYSFAVSYDAASHAGQLIIYPASNTSGAQLNSMPNVTGSGVRTCYFMATGTTSYVLVQGLSVTSGVSIFFDNISVRELAGNHATAPTDTARLTYGVEPKTGRRNLLTWSEGFDNAVWAKAGAASITPDDTPAPNGALTADKITGTATVGFGTVVVSPAIAIVSATTYRASCYMKAGTAGWGSLQFGNGGPDAGRLSFNLSTGQLGSAQAFGSGWTYVAASGAIENVGGGWYRCSAAFLSGGTSGVVTIAAANSDNSVSITAGQFNHIWGAQLELGSTATAYQRVTTAYDVTEAGVPTCHYVQYDGVDDSMSTAAIDFTATDKISVFAGVRKLSDVTEQILYELSASAFANPNSFAMYAGDNGTARGAFWTGLNHGNGTPVSAEYSAVAGAPVSTMLTALLAIQSTPRTVIRTNGTVIGTLTGTADAGSFGNWPLFIGRRNNASFPFNGKDYGIIVVGKTASAAEIASTEAYLAANTSGVTLP